MKTSQQESRKVFSVLIQTREIFQDISLSFAISQITPYKMLLLHFFCTVRSREENLPSQSPRPKRTPYSTGKLSALNHRPRVIFQTLSLHTHRVLCLNGNKKPTQIKSALLYSQLIKYKTTGEYNHVRCMMTDHRRSKNGGRRGKPGVGC